MKKRTYNPLPIYSNKTEVEAVLKNGTKKDLMLLSLGVGESYPDWEYAQSVCLKLAKSKDPEIRANACLGFAYIARTKGKVDRGIVEPVLLQELKTQTENKWRIVDAIDDLNYHLKWNLKYK